MTIVHIDMGTTLRGGQRQLLRLARGLAERDHNQTIVCPETSDLARRAQDEGHRVFALPALDLGFAHGMVQLRQWLLASPAQILHAHDGRGQTVSWLSSWGLPVRRVASRRVTFLPGARFRHRFIYSRTCHAVIAVSQFVRNLLVESGVPGAQIEVIPDGIEIPETIPSAEERSQARTQWNLGIHDFVIGYMGAATPEKGLALAVAAFALASQRLPPAKLLVLGETPPDVRDRLFKVASHARPGLQFLSPQENVRPFFAAIDLFWMPSLAEGLGSAALLAMAHGCPVVASRAGGLPEVVDDGRTGWLVGQGEAMEFAEITWQASGNAVRLKQMGTDARERARLFSTAIMVARTERLYRQLV
jgi:glycosyltransferase involved in cell wall biosynthesis